MSRHTLPPPTFVQTLSDGTSVYTEKTKGLTAAEAQTAVLQQWEKDHGLGGNGTDPGADGVSIEAGSTTADGATTYYVVPSTEENVGASDPSGASKQSQYSSLPGFSETSQLIANQNYPAAQQSFTNMLSDAWMNGPNIDINGLIQAVMRNAYEDNQQDLKYYALKVQFYNNLKKAIRAELARAREWQSTHEPSGTNSGSAPLTAPFVPGPTLSTHPLANSTEVMTEQQALDQGYQNTSNAGQNPNGTGSTGAPTTTGPQGVGGGLTEVDPSTVTFNPPLYGSNSGNSTQAKDWKIYKTTDGHYIAVNFNGHEKGAGEARVYEPGSNGQPGNMIEQVFGDPHLNGSGNAYAAPSSSSHGFNQYGTFGLVLPDGTALSFKSTTSIGGVAGINQIDITSGLDHYSLTSSADGTSTSETYSNDGATYIDQTSLADAGALFAIKDDNGTVGTAEVDQSLGGGVWAVVNDQNNTPNSGKIATGLNATGLTDGQQALASHQGNVITTANQLDAYIQNEEDLLQSVGDDAQLAQVDLQNMAQKQQQTLQTLSNLSKSFHDLSMAIIRNISG